MHLCALMRKYAVPGLIASLGTHADAVEGVRSFLEKRAPDFPLTVPDGLPELPWTTAR